MSSHDDPGERGRQEPPPGVWDEQLADEIIGLRMIVGLTYLDGDGGLIQQLQFFGIVKTADRGVGIILALEGTRAGQFYTLPPDTRGLKRGEIGNYTLRSTGEVVSDPDYTCSFTIQRP